MLGRVAPIIASLLIHAGVAGMIALAPGWTAVSESVFFLDLVEAPAPPPPVDQPKPAAPDRRPLTLPRPIQTPPPKINTPAFPSPEPDPVAPAPPLPSPPVASEPPAPAPPSSVAAVPSAPTPSPSDAAVSLPASPSISATPAPSSPAAMSLPAAPPPVSTAPQGAAAAASGAPGPAVASVPRHAVTQAAAPRGGYQHRPTYPASARRAGVQGTTLLSVFVASDGRVGDVHVKESAGHPDLDRAATDAVRRWRFEPARRGTEAVAMWVLLPVEFRLR